MPRIFSCLLLAGVMHAAQSAVEFDAAANLYREAAVREQVRPSLATMPEHIRQMFTVNGGEPLSEQQLSALETAAKRGFRIDVFEPPAISAFARSLDPATVAKAQAFLASAVGRRMVADDVALADLGESNIDKVMNGDLASPSTPRRDALVDRLERAAQSTESTVQVFLSMGEAVAVGTAVGSGLDPAAVRERAHRSGDATRPGLEQNMRNSMRRLMAYGYRDLSDADLERLLHFLESAPGRHYVIAYNAAMDAGFDAMGRRCGERLGEGLRELAMAQADARAVGVPADPAPTPPSPAP